MKRPGTSARGTISRLIQEAGEAWRKQEYSKTIELLERASRLDPSNPSLLLDLGRAYGLRYDYPSAEQCLEKAVRVSPSKAEILARAGGRCQEFGHFQMATSYFERALKSDPESVGSLVTLAELYERQHRLEESVALVNRALKKEPQNSRSLLVAARLHRLKNEWTEAERIIRGVLAQEATQATHHLRAWYELGQLLDKQGRYDEAMAAFLEAKAGQRLAGASFHPILLGIQERVREMEKSISAEVLHRWAAEGSGLEPIRRLAVLCGHPRSGTTLLEQMLDAHPGIVSAEETHILHDEAYLPLSRGFPEDASILEVLDSAPRSRLQQSRENYFQATGLFIQQEIGDRLLIDKNPALNVLIPAVVRLFPEARFLVALRDPRDVCLSCFMQPLPLNPVSSAYLTLEGTIRQYLSVIGFWRSILPKLPNRWMEVRYEDFVDDPPAVSGKVLQILEMPWNSEVLRFQEHARSKAVRSPTYADVVKPVYRQAIGRWRNYQKYFEPYLEKLQPLAAALGYE